MDGSKVGEPLGFFARVWNTYSPLWKVSEAPTPEKQFLIDIEFDGRPSLKTNGKGIEYTPEQRSEITRLMGESGTHNGTALDTGYYFAGGGGGGGHTTGNAGYGVHGGGGGASGHGTGLPAQPTANALNAGAQGGTGANAAGAAGGANTGSGGGGGVDGAGNGGAGGSGIVVIRYRIN